MWDQQSLDGGGGWSGKGRRRASVRRIDVSRQWAIGLILLVALFAFEVFNFDTTRYALSDLLGEVNFAGIPWAAILAVAFCAIDFAGLAHLFTPQRGWNEPKEVWYLMGAWLLGATMNALMTWWAVNLTLLNHQFGNEVLSREQLLQIVPPFVAVLVWLTRILFIGAFSVAGEHFFESERPAVGASVRPAVPAALAGRRRAAEEVEEPLPLPSRQPASQRRPAQQRSSIPAGLRPIPAPVSMSGRGRQGD